MTAPFPSDESTADSSCYAGRSTYYGLIEGGLGSANGLAFESGVVSEVANRSSSARMFECIPNGTDVFS